jgi:putative endonuclease
MPEPSPAKGDASSSPRLPWWRRWFGTRSERAAAKYLKQLGYRIVGRNVRFTQGELDLVAVDGQCVVFVEVRSTEREDAFGPACSVGPEKQRRLTNLAIAFLRRHRLLGHAARFDVVTVCWPAQSRKPSIQHFKNAFEAVGRLQMFR